MAVDKITVQYEADLNKLESDLDHLEDHLVGIEKTAKKSSKGVEDGFEKADKSVNSLNGKLTELAKRLPGAGVVEEIKSLSKAFESTSSATDKASKSMNILKIAIAATGIGALVIAVGSLVAYFTKTERGAEMLERALAGVGATVKVIIGRFASLGEGLVKIFTGDFSEGAKILKGAFSGMIDEIKTSTQATIELTGALQDVEDEERKLSVINAKRKNEVDLLLKIARDRGKSEADRLKALDKAGQVEKASIEDQIKLQEKKVAALQKENDLKVKTGELDKGNITQELQESLIQLENLRGNSEEILQNIQNRRSLILQSGLRADSKTEKDFLKERQKDLEEYLTNVQIIENRKNEILNQGVGKEKKMQSILTDAHKKEMDKRLEDYKLSEKSKSDAVKEEERERQQVRQAAEQFAENLGHAAVSFVSDQEKAKTDLAISENRKVTDDRITSLEKKRDAGIISERQYNDQKDKIQKDSAKRESQLKLEAAKKEKELQIFNILINALANAVKVFPNPYLIALAAAQGALNAGLVAARPLPKFKKGGSPGELKGRSHEEGGIPIEVEGGEYIVSKDRYSKHKDIVKEVNFGNVEKYIEEKRVIPALKAAAKRREAQAQKDMAHNIYEAMKLQAFDDSNITRAIKRNKSVALENVDQLGKAFAKYSDNSLHNQYRA